MSGFKEPSLADRQKAAQQARQNMLNKFRSQPGLDDPAVKQRQAEREAHAAERSKARLAREAAKARAGGRASFNEMRVEQQIHALLHEHHNCVVTAVPDPSRGERLVAFYTDPELTPQELWEKLCHTDLPKLWLPKRDA